MVVGGVLEMIKTPLLLSKMTMVLSLIKGVFLMQYLRITEKQIKSPQGNMKCLRGHLLLIMS